MEDLQQQQQGRARRRVGVGEIVEVKGGHVIRSTRRGDRHSKVFTARGPRDRRVRLSAHTAIQFYDVQDRLGFDRPSKAVDWLIRNAKAAIDQLAENPPWVPAGQILPGGEDGILPPSLDRDAIADTIKSFFHERQPGEGEQIAFPAGLPWDLLQGQPQDAAGGSFLQHRGTLQSIASGGFSEYGFAAAGQAEKLYDGQNSHHYSKPSSSFRPV